MEKDEKKSNLFRAILRVYSEKEQKPINIIGKLVEISLLDEKEPLNLIQISEKLKSKIDIEFDKEQIINGILKRKINFEISNESNLEESLYKIKDIIKKKIDSEYSEVVDKIIEGFISYIQIETTKEEFYELFKKFIYSVFNNTQSQIISILNNSYVFNNETKSFSSREIMFLNEFIKWENHEKNAFLAKTISYGFEYCLLVTNTNSSELKDIFRKTFFYFDANIIISSTGIDGELRKLSTLKFFRKLKELNSQLFITSETFKEIKKTIAYKIDGIKTLISST